MWSIGVARNRLKEVTNGIKHIIKKEGHFLIKGDAITIQTSVKGLDITGKTALGTEMSNATNAALDSPRLDFMDECSALDPDLMELAPLPPDQARWPSESRILELSKH